MQTTLDTPPRNILGLRASALLEIALFFIAMFAIDFLFGSGNRFENVSPHPYWIIVLLIACQYGTSEGLIAALAATFALLLFNLPQQQVGEDLYQYLLLITRIPILWLIAAVVLGELRVRHLRERERLKAELFDARERENIITYNYESVKAIKEKMELRIAGQMRSTVDTYHAAKALEKLNPQDVLQGIESLVSVVLDPESFSIYRVTPSGFELTLAHGWKPDATYPRVIKNDSNLYRAIAAEHKLLTVTNPEHEQLLAGQAVLAAPLIDRTSGEVIGMIKVERMGFANLNFSSIETFQAICEWGSASLSNSARFARAQEGSIVNPDHNLYTANYFDRYTAYITGLAKRVGFDVTQLAIRLADSRRMDEDTQLRVGKALANSVDSVLRSVDTAFDYQPQTGEFSIVLPATNQAGAQKVLEKIRQELSRQLRSTGQADITYSINPLYERQAA